MRRSGLETFALALPLAKVVLVGELWRAHGLAPGAAALVAPLPEALVAVALIGLGAWTTPRSVGRICLAGISFLLALATWIAVAAWGFTGTIVSYDLFARLARAPEIVQTAIRAPDLRFSMIAWTGGFLALLAVSRALVSLAERMLPNVALRPAAIAVALPAVVGLALLRSAAPIDRLAILAASAPVAVASTADPALDPATLRDLAPPIARRRSAALPDVKHVLVVVLESIRWEPGSPFVTGFPEAAHFDRVYAHHPRSVKTLETLLFGILPSPQRETAAWSIDQYDTGSIGALPALLRDRGFATSYLGSTDLQFDNLIHTLAAAGVDRTEGVTDDRGLTWGASADAVLGRAAEILEDGERDDRRQLAIVWTTECHRPYDVATSGIREGTDADRYRACARLLARSVENLLSRLRRSGLLDRTLVILFGDHGQLLPGEHQGETAFGQHVYEGELHVPLLILSPGQPPSASAGARDDRLFQLVDVPATIASAVGAPVPRDWVGRDMLDPREPGRRHAFLMSQLDPDVEASVDAGGKKVVRTRQERLIEYDLATDPLELHPHDVAPAESAAAAARLRSYVAAADSGWRDRLISEQANRLVFRGPEVANFGRPGGCIHLSPGPDGESTAVVPSERGPCRDQPRPRSLETIRLLSSRTLAAAAGLRLRLRVRLDEPPPEGERPHARARLGDRHGAVSQTIEPVAGRWQEIVLNLPIPAAARMSDGAGSSIPLHVVPVDARLRYSVAAIEVEPLSADEPVAARRADAAPKPSSR